ncbi:MAG: hypothetical protein KAG72_01735 [Abyssibacter sp.]|jgi:hypothetical protein|nr:hypothetical protein [Abyssibacter sp.]MCK5858042.1 hypothetical protein [Abyssibacter sp.]
MNVLLGLIAMPFILAWKLVWNVAWSVIVFLVYVGPFALPLFGAAYMNEQGR